MKQCRYCAEDIQDAAIVCKHCGRDVPAPKVAEPTTQNSAASKSPVTNKALKAVGIFMAVVVVSIFGVGACLVALVGLGTTSTRATSSAPSTSSLSQKSVSTTAAAASTATYTLDIRTKCAAEWPDDFQMRAYCEGKQHTALANLTKRSMESRDEVMIRNKCATEWPTDYTMRDYCEGKQLQALGQLK